MKRRSFLQWCMGVLGVGTLGVSAAKAKPLESDVYAPNNPNSKVKWRKWGTLEKEPEAYTQEDIDAASGINKVMLGQPPFCGTCNKFKVEGKCYEKKAWCYDNPISPKPTEPTDTACHHYNKPPQDDVSCVYLRGYRIIAYRNIVQWSKDVGESCGAIDIMQMERHLNGIELKTKDVCKDMYVGPCSPLITDEHVFWWGERELWRINYVGGEKIFQVVFVAKATHTEKLTGVLRNVIEEVPKLKSTSGA